jgi:hypothetical protein
MLAKPKLAGPLAALLAASALLFSACSSSHPRDINYGTDADLDFVPPDGGTGSSIDTDNTSGAIDGSLGSEAGAFDASASNESNDAGDQVDVSLGTNN